MNLKCSSVDGGEGTLGNCGPGGQEQQRDKEGGGRKLILGFKDLIWWSWNFARQLLDVQTKRDRRQIWILFEYDSLLFVAQAGQWRGRLFAVKNLILQGRMENGLFLQRNCVYAARVGRGLTAVFFTFPALLHHYYTTVFVFCKSCLPMQEQSSISGSQSRPCVAIVIHMKY